LLESPTQDLKPPKYFKVAAKYIQETPTASSVETLDHVPPLSQLARACSWRYVLKSRTLSIEMSVFVLQRFSEQRLVRTVVAWKHWESRYI